MVENETNQQDQKPQELCCTVCEKLMTDAVLLPCCGKSFCKECTYDCFFDNPCCIIFSLYIVFSLFLYILFRTKHRLKWGTFDATFIFVCLMCFFLKMREE